MAHLLLSLSLAATLPAAPLPPEVAATIAANNQFALDLYGRLGAGGGNLFFSPYSVNKALAMAYAGARGATAAEMAAVLHLPADQVRPHRGFLEMRKLINHNPGGLFGIGRPLFSQGPQLAQAAALWGQTGYGFHRPFLTLLQDHYDAGLNEVDFQAGDRARQTINSWVAKQTGGKIPELFGPNSLGPNTRLVLATAIYFKGDWVSPFKKDSTRSEPFFQGADRRAPVPMMSQTETFGYAEVEGAQLLEMPYVGKDLALLVVLPRDVDGLPALERALTAEKLATWVSGLSEQKVRVSFPRFKMEQGFDLPAALTALGMKTAFVPGTADFRGMNAGKEPLWLSAAVHKAYVDVNELGTEAAAATGVAVAGLAMREFDPPVFRADHPFLFAIRDVRSGVILFLGRYAQP
jgi:serpin B